MKAPSKLPDNPEIWYMRGLAFAEIDRTEVNLCFEKLFELMPEYAAAWVQWDSSRKGREV